MITDDQRRARREESLDRMRKEEKRTGLSFPAFAASRDSQPHPAVADMTRPGGVREGIRQALAEGQLRAVERSYGVGADQEDRLMKAAAAVTAAKEAGSAIDGPESTDALKAAARRFLAGGGYEQFVTDLREIFGDRDDPKTGIETGYAEDSPVEKQTPLRKRRRRRKRSAVGKVRGLNGFNKLEPREQLAVLVKAMVEDEIEEATR